MSGYIQRKSEMLLELGLDPYRERDFFRYPPRSLNEAEAQNLMAAAQQIVDGRGFDPDQPITGIDLNHLILFLHCFHFKEGRIESALVDGTWHDQVPAAHIMTPMETVLHCRSSQDTVRSRKTRRRPVFQRIGPDFLPPLQYQPVLLESREVETGTLGEYRFVLHTDCHAKGTIAYKHVLFFYAPEQTQTCLAVTAEHSSLDPAVLMLCVFDGRRHKNLGSRHAVAGVDDFKRAAMAVAADLLSPER